MMRLTKSEEIYYSKKYGIRKNSKSLETNKKLFEQKQVDIDKEIENEKENKRVYNYDDMSFYKYYPRE